MIIPNATLQWRAPQVWGTDPDTGQRVPPANGGAWSAPVRAQAVPSSMSLLERAQGERITAERWDVYIEDNGGPMPTEQLRLTLDHDQEHPREASMRSAERLQAVAQIRIRL